MVEPWWQSLARIVGWILTRVLAPFLAIGWPALVIYGLLAPRVNDLSALGVHSGQVPLLIGVAQGGAGCTPNHGCTSVLPQRLYIVIPRALTTMSVSAVEGSDSHLEVSEHPGAALFAIAIWGACIYTTWYFWVRLFVKASN
jgi:hypothetical protein